MKKTYIIPFNKVANIEAENLIADSLRFSSARPAIENAGVDDNDATNGGAGLAKGQNSWDNEW